MPTEQNPTNAILSKLSEAYSQVQLGPGVMGKTSRVTLALLFAWVVIFFRLSNEWVLNGCLLLGGSIVTAVYLWWVNKSQKFAEDHPDLALLEGAQFIEYQKWEAEVKGMPPSKALPIPDPALIEQNIPKSIGVRKSKHEK